MEQFGVYLTPLNHVAYQMSLCPTYYNHITISDHHKQFMAKTLYQKLQDPEAIPLEHTSIWNIINRYA